MKLHPCLAAMGNTSDCQTCSVSKAGLLDEFLDFLSRITHDLRAKPNLQDADREEIIAELAARVHQKIEHFRGKSSDGLRNVKFRTWGRKLYSGVTVDFFRKKLGRRSKGESAPEMVNIEDLSNPLSVNPEPAMQARMTLSAIRGMLGKKELKSHVELLIDHYEWQVQGLSQQDMAQKMGLGHAAFRKKVSRARRAVMAELGDDHI